MNANTSNTIPMNAPSIAGKNTGGSNAKPMKQPPPKAVRRMQKRLNDRRLAHSATLANLSKRASPTPASAFKTPGSQKK